MHAHNRERALIESNYNWVPCRDMQHATEAVQQAVTAAKHASIA